MNAIASVGDDEWIIKEYEFVAILGKGSFATAYKARHRSLGVDHVIKVLNVDLLHRDDGDDYPALFRKEAQVLARIRHPNIPAVFACAETLDGRPYFVMDFLNGRDLRGVVADQRGAPLPIRFCINLAIYVFDGLEAAHQFGVVHRDIKPENILIVRPDSYSENPTAKVIDFGISSTAGKTEKRNGHVVCRGSERYAPPEQFTGLPLTASADIYSVGVVLHELITGIHPFRWLRSDEGDALIEAHATKELTAISEVRPDAPQKLVRLVESFLQKDPSKRPASAELCARRLRDLKDELDVDATVTRVGTARNFVLRSASSTKEVRSEDASSTSRSGPESKDLDASAKARRALDYKTDVDAPSWLEDLIAEQAAKGDLGPEPETFVARTAEDEAVLIDLNRLEADKVFAQPSIHTEPTPAASVHTDPTRSNTAPLVRVAKQEATTSPGLGPVWAAPEAVAPEAVPVIAPSADDSSENVWLDSPLDAAEAEAAPAVAARRVAAGSEQISLVQVRTPVDRAASHASHEHEFAQPQHIQAPRALVDDEASDQEARQALRSRRLRSFRAWVAAGLGSLAAMTIVAALAPIVRDRSLNSRARSATVRSSPVSPSVVPAELTPAAPAAPSSATLTESPDLVRPIGAGELTKDASAPFQHPR